MQPSKSLNRTVILFSLLLLQIIAFTAQAQQKALTFDNLTLEDGLSQSTINCMLQDTDGYIWVGTRGGLNKYNGIDFEMFSHNPSDSTSLVNNIIYCLYEDHQGKIWIGTQFGLSIFDHQYQNFTAFAGKGEQGLSSNTVTGVLQDSLNHYWIATNPGGLHKVTFAQNTNGEYSDRSITLFQNILGNPRSLSSNKITCMLEDRYGFFWIGTADKGLNKFDPYTGKVTRYVFQEDSRNTLLSNHIQTLYEDFDGNIWVGTDKGVNKLSLSKKQKRKLDKNERISAYLNNDEKGRGSNSILAFAQTDSSSLWIGTDDVGVKMLDLPTERIKSFVHSDTRPKSLLSNNIISMLSDKEGTLWVGTNAGLSKANQQGARFHLLQRNPSNPNTLSSDNIQMIYKERSGTIWIGTFDGGLNKYNSRTGKFTTYTSKDIFDAGESRTEAKKLKEQAYINSLSSRRKRRYLRNRKEKPKPLFLSNDRVLSLHRDKNKTVWIGTGGGGLNKLDLRDESFTHYKADLGNTDSLSNNIIWAIYEDKHHNLWLGTEGGLNIFKNGRFQRYMNDPNDANSLSHNDVRTILEDRNGNFWIGTYGGGLNKFVPQEKKFYRYQSNGKNSLASNAVFSLYEDSVGIIWVGTSAGLNKFDPESETFTLYSVEDGLPNNFVYGILEDQHHNLWLSTNKGLSRFNMEKETFKNYDQKDGLQSNEFNPGAYFKTPSGELLFGGIQGLNYFYTDEIKDNQILPKIVITDFKIFNKSVPVGGDLLQRDISATGELELSHRDHVISFEFTGLSFQHAEKNQYAYKLENFDKDWNYVGTRRFASYTNLPPGEYTFKVIGSNNDGVWNEEGAAIQITIHPPFWNTWWFYTLCGLLSVVLLYGLIQYRFTKLREAKVELEKQVNIRTKELQVEKERVESANLEVDQKNKELLKKNQDITSSIAYAKRIQEAILPLDIQQKLPESFVLYKPRDIVSGDFYWHTQKGNKILLAAVDCTGHGVPGAFMSMIGHTLLNEIVNTKQVTQPAEILYYLNMGVREILNQDQESIKSRDGMDISICAIDLENKQLEYAGAKRPLYLVQNGEFQEIKGDKISVGGIQRNKEASYTNHCIPLEDGLLIYMASDGYADQVGGPKKSKYLTKHFKTLLYKNHHQPINKQYQILEKEIDSWQGSEKQVDDILVMGVKVTV
ncbi:two-component regulator propeller domain-containing protein [Rapidithrix thailandica]|uniref:Two-component regulator propeller domain-containing protein n=1 Tax=Rapidithrix thailandica TaxID=413964 RepID=A0AAW9SDB8_9BACT